MNASANRKNFIWNFSFSIIQALQSVLLLLVVNRILGENAAGIFGYAFSVAILFMYVGNYGIRNYQVSDTEEKYSPYEYYGFRLITGIIMIVTVILYNILLLPSYNKMMCIIFLSVGRLSECLEDVFHGRFQQKGDLYLAGIQGSVRYIIIDILFLAALLFSKDLIIACLIYGLSSLLCVVIFTMITIKKYGGFKISFNINAMKGIAIACFPLFLGYFLSTYLTNVPKYTIERYINLFPNIFTDADQAFFNMIFMPVLMINLLSLVIFRPFIVDMATFFNNKDFSKYKKLFNKQILFITIIGIIIIPMCYVLGIPVLSIFYNSDLSAYKNEFMILMIGGLFSAYSCFFNICIITIRKQISLLVATLVISIAAFVINHNLNAEYGLLGISIAYLIIMILQAFVYFLIHLFSIKSDKG